MDKEESQSSHECGLESFKKDYSELEKKYELPKFSELNEMFEIEELESCETEFLIKKIRRIISEKIAGYLRFVETILNPSNAPMFFFKMIKKLDNGDKETLNKIYEELGKFEVEIIKLDLEYNAEKEAEFIKKMFSEFNKIRKNLLAIVDKLGNGENNGENSGSASYFG